ncbi:putative ATPase [Nakamurella sp. UYEF19]|uniref:AAA family ATPase n=1 Tax=Nakamurella sp. UYEF19 TaxID=1756392 RepID=UPI003392C7CD
MATEWGRPLKRVSGETAHPLEESTWPGSIPAVRQVLEDGLDLGGLTVLVGDNGAGKSTIVEAIAMAFGMSSEGGSTGARHTTRPSESVLHEHLRLTRGIGGARWGFFLRAETMHSFYTYLEGNPGRGDAAFHEMSHGESFLEVLSARFGDSGLYVLDEPEAALSFQGSLALVEVLRDIAESRNAQAVVATHSPIVAATPGAVLYEVGPWGLRPSTWEDLTLVRHWRSFLGDPEIYLRHLR